MSKPLRLVDGDKVGERGQHGEVQQERPADMHARRVPVVKHPQELEQHLKGHHPSEDRPDQYRRHPYELDQAGQQPLTLNLLNARYGSWGRLHRLSRGGLLDLLGELDDIGHSALGYT